MLKRVYVVYDKLADEYSDPICIKNDKLANRFFVAELKKVTNKDDYIIYNVGEYDSDSANFYLDDKQVLDLDFGVDVSEVIE